MLLAQDPDGFLSGRLGVARFFDLVIKRAETSFYRGVGHLGRAVLPLLPVAPTS